MRKNSYIIIVALLALFLANGLHAQIIIRFAGDTVQGHTGDGGPATAAEMNQPCSVIQDAMGNIYIGEGNGCVIRKVNPMGVISTYAGTGTAGFSGDGGPAIAAKINGVDGMTFDASGNLVFGDFANSCIRKIDGAGTITTIAGTGGVSGYSGDGGSATAAKFNRVMDVKYDAAGNLYISDWSNYVIRKINTSGTISTIAGTNVSGYTGDGGPATAAKISLPYGLAFDASGSLYFIDGNNNCVRKIDASGNIHTVCGNGTPGSSGDGGPATAALLSAPTDLAFDSYGNLDINDRGNDRIRQINTSGIISTIAGNGGMAEVGDGGPATAASFNRNYGIYADTNNNIYTADINGNAVRKIIARPHAVYTSPGTLCQDSCTTLINTGKGSLDSVRWSVPGVTITGAATDTMHACFTSPGSYPVHLYVHNISGSDTMTATLVVNPTPHPVITTTLFTTFSVPGTYSSYQWYHEGLPVSGATTDTLVAVGIGSYWVIVDSGGCPGRSDTGFVWEGVPTINLSANHFWLSQDGSSKLSIYTDKTLADNISVSLFDITGKQILSDSWSKGSNSKQINDIPVPVGLYIIRLTSLSTLKVLKWMKQ